MKSIQTLKKNKNKTFRPKARLTLTRISTVKKPSPPIFHFSAMLEKPVGLPSHATSIHWFCCDFPDQVLCWFICVEVTASLTGQEKMLVRLGWGLLAKLLRNQNPEVGPLSDWPILGPLTSPRSLVETLSPPWVQLGTLNPNLIIFRKQKTVFF